MGLLDSIFKNQKNQNATTSNTAPAESKGKILIVEDEKMLADALELKLKNEGFDVIRAENGQIGLDKILSDRPHLVLLDLMMPVMNGKQMLQKLREMPEFKALPVVVLTNAGDADNIRETKFYYNAADFLIKSNVSIDEIANKVKSMVKSY